MYPRPWGAIQSELWLSFLAANQKTFPLYFFMQLPKHLLQPLHKIEWIYHAGIICQIWGLRCQPVLQKKIDIYLIYTWWQIWIRIVLLFVNKFAVVWGYMKFIYVYVWGNMKCCKMQTLMEGDQGHLQHGSPFSHPNLNLLQPKSRNF